MGGLTVEANIIGERIKFLRKISGLSQVQLAEGIITQAQISNIEKGRIIPLCTTLFQLANKLGVDVNYFFEYAYNSRNDYVNEVKVQIRKAIRERDYKEVERLIKAEQNNPSFKMSSNWQFLLWHKGVVEYYIKQDLNKSLSTLQEALDMNIDISISNLKMQKIEILNSIAIIYNEIGEFQKSIQMYKQAFLNLDKLIDVRDIRIEVRLCYGIAKSLYKIGQFQQSLSFCKRGIRLCIENEVMYLLGELFYQAGQNLEELDNLRETEIYYLKAKYIFDIENKDAFIKIVENQLKQVNLH